MGSEGPGEGERAGGAEGTRRDWARAAANHSGGVCRVAAVLAGSFSTVTAGGGQGAERDSHGGSALRTPALSLPGTTGSREDPSLQGDLAEVPTGRVR